MIRPENTQNLQELKNSLILRNYSPSEALEKLGPHEYFELKKCVFKNLKKDRPCLIWIQKQPPFEANIVVFDPKFSEFYKGNFFEKVNQLALDPILFSAKEDGAFTFRKKVSLSQTPYFCLQSLLTAEDQNFLLHQGASFPGIFRAFIRNLKTLRIKEGGSTITQQLIKNKFLSSEKTFRRKLTELIMALILEKKLNKDQILELYLNTVYMGSSESHSIYGFSSASLYYFNKPLEKLKVEECSLLTVLIPSPGRFNPFSNPEKSLVRRNHLLKKMREKGVISEQELQNGIKTPLPLKRKKYSAPYFVSSVQEYLKNIELKDTDLHIYTTLDMTAQEKADKVLKTFSQNKKNSSPEAALVFVDLKTNKVRAISGGLDFNKSQFNRAVHSKRSVGSLIKPWTYMAVLSLQNKTPSSLILDEPFSYEYQGRSWSPKNYKDKYYGNVPLYFALKESLNTASAKLALNLGIENVIQTLKKLGLSSPVQKLPSLVLGALDLSPLEAAQMYSTIARMGSRKTLSFIEKIQDPSGKLLYQSSHQAQQVFSKKDTAVLMGMMRQVIESGTAQWIKPFWPYPSAGKTGTSNEERDAWFAGFTPEWLSVVWLGKDDFSSHQLTGASGALPLWLKFMKSLEKSKDFSKDFDWPEGVKKKKISVEKNLCKTPECKLELIFKVNH